MYFIENVVYNNNSNKSALTASFPDFKGFIVGDLILDSSEVGNAFSPKLFLYLFNSRSPRYASRLRAFHFQVSRFSHTITFVKFLDVFVPTVLRSLFSPMTPF